jgi:hypothetical protein
LPPPDSFWEKTDKAEKALAKPVRVPATASKKKKNHARRERREATRKRLAEEKIKEEERRARIKRREELRERRRNTPRPAPRKPLPETPVRIPLEDGSNHWRLPRKTDLKRYVIRKFPGKTRRVWVQPCWAEVASVRKFIGKQEKHDVLRFMKAAIKLQVPEATVDAVQSFIEDPYFLMSQFLPSGRATSDLRQQWKVEDSIEDTKGFNMWTSVEDRIKKRKLEGRKRKKLSGNHPQNEEEISYLTVNCDFMDDQTEPRFLPERALATPVDGFFYFQECTTKFPIQGPMTLKESQEVEWQIVKIDELKPIWKESRETYKIEEEVWRQWTPRKIEEEYPQEEQIPVKVFLDEIKEECDWALRKGLEWEDLRFLVNAKLGHDQWAACEYLSHQLGARLEKYVGCIRKGKWIRIIRPRKDSPCKEKAETRRLFGEQVLDHFQELDDWLPTRTLSTQPEDLNPTIQIDYPTSSEKLVLQLPQGHE